MAVDCETRHLVVTWAIENFSTRVRRLELRNNFPTHFRLPASWEIFLYPNGYYNVNDDIDEKDRGVLIIYNVGGGAVEDDFYVKFTILDRQLNKRVANSFEKNLREESYWTHHLVKRSFVLDAQNDILDGDRLVIQCEVSRSSEFYTSHTRGEIEAAVTRSQEFDEFETLLCNSDLYADVTLCVDRRKLPAHKNVLACRSTVFRAMFEHEMREQASSTVTIKDVGYRVMKELLRFMYCGRIEDVDEVAGDLLAAANKYAVQGLKSLAQDSLRKTLTIENSVDYLVLADAHEATGLKGAVIDFMVKNWASIVRLDSFKTIGNSLQKYLYIELLSAACEKLHYYV